MTPTVGTGSTGHKLLTRRTFALYHFQMIDIFTFAVAAAIIRYAYGSYTQVNSLMKILLLTKKFPYPTKDGESIAVHSLSKQLLSLGAEVHLLSMNTTKHYTDVSAVRPHIGQYASVTTCPVDNKITVWAALQNLFSGESYHISRFALKSYSNELQKLLTTHKFDVVLLESVYLTPYIADIREASKASVVMRAHNIEYEIWQRIANNSTNPLKKWYLGLQVGRLRAYEHSQLALLDGLITFTHRDMEKYCAAGYQGPELVSPIGINTEEYKYDLKLPQQETVAFIGSLDWQPNIEGLQWFLNKVWPLVIAARPQAECHIAGRNPSRAIMDISQAGVVIHGEVGDAQVYVRSHPISIVPLLSGSGMRVKILEAMALARCTVTTSVGAEGIDTSTMLVADDPATFASHIITVLVDKKQQKKLGRRAADYCARHYDARSNAESVFRFLKQIVAKHS